MSILRLQKYSPDLNLPYKDESGRPTPFETGKEIGEETLDPVETPTGVRTF